MVVGDRLSSTYFAENKRPFHNLGNGLVRASINHLFGSDIKDIMTGYRAFSYAFVKTYPVLSKGFEIETDMTIHAINRRMQVSNIVVSYRDRPVGSESKLNTYQDGAKVLLTIARLYKNYRPFAFFGLLALILAVISAAFMIPVLMEFAADRACAAFSDVDCLLRDDACGAAAFHFGSDFVYAPGEGQA